MKHILFLLLFMSGTIHAGASDNTLPREETFDVAADFELRDVNDQLHRLSDYRGQWVVVNFWATWCGPCVTEIPELNRFHQQHHAKGTTVIGINFEELSTERLKQAIGEFGISYPVLRIGSVPLVPFEPLKGLPSTFAVSPDGRLVRSWLGPVNETVLEAYILPRLAAGNMINQDITASK